MNQWAKRLTAVCSVLVWLGVSALVGGGTALADGVQDVSVLPVGGSVGEQVSGITLEQAIGVAKQFIQVPDDYKNFQPNYNNTAGLIIWDLSWNSDDPSGGSISARVNAATGELWGLQQWQPQPVGDSGRGLPKLNRSEAEAKATDFLNQVLPKYSGSLTIDPDATTDPNLGLRNTGATVYSFNFDRMVNGIPFTENSANVQVDAHTGAINGFNFNWDNTIVFPEAQGLLQPGQAEPLWRANAQVQLTYFAPMTDGKMPDKARLLYAPKNSALMIDARSGEILKPDDNYDRRMSDMREGAGSGMSSKDQAVPLTPAEQAALIELGKLISQDQALKTALSLVEIPEGLVLQSSSLQQDYQTGGRVWNFYWYDPDGQRSLSVQIDAGQNRLISYNLMTPQQDQLQTPRLNEDQARDLATGFLSAAAGDLRTQMETLRLVPTAPIRPLADEKAPPASFSFTADRLANGIPFSGNGVSLTVDAVQGKVTSYMLNWWQVKFPDASGAIGQSQAEDAFLADGALALSYRREFAAPDQASGQMPPVRLVYTLVPEAPYYVDAFTGLSLDAVFQPKINPEQQVFTDLAGIPGAEAVNILTEARIIPVYDTSFHPTEALSQRDWLIWLVRASGWQSTPAADPDQEFQKDYQQAFSLGILKAGEQYLPDGDLDRITMARMVVRALGWDEVAGFQGIWSVPSEIVMAAADQGYLALAAGLGIIDPNDKEFDPSAGLARLEGAVALNKVLN